MPGAALQAISPIDEALSCRLWAELAAPEGKHLMESLDTILSADEAYVIVAHDLWNDDQSPKELGLVLKNRGLNHWSIDTPIIVFWHAQVSVLTKWHIFLQHWDDFFYPSDDSGVVASLDGAVNLYFVEGHMFWVDRIAALRGR